MPPARAAARHARRPAPAPDARSVAAQVADNHRREVVKHEGQEHDGNRRLQRAPVRRTVQQRVGQGCLPGARAQDDCKQAQQHRGEALQCTGVGVQEQRLDSSL